MPFRLWPAQIVVMDALMVKRLLIILKARQLGISWIACAYALWLCLFQPGKLVICFSKGEKEAQELIRRIQALYDRLPAWLSAELPQQTKDNAGDLAWANGSRVQSLAASAHAGRSFTASLVILDEAAFLTYANKIYVALKPTIDGGGQLIILSTANGLGNLYHLLWTRAVAGANAFHPIFLPWWSRPGRTRAWYAQQTAEYTDPELVKQEYPASANEAFLASGRARFASAWISAQAGNIRSGRPAQTWPASLRALQHLPGLTIYEPPRAGRRYLIGADVAEGLEQRDYNRAVLIDRATREEIASLGGHWEPDVFADYLIQLGSAYQAEIAVERNNHGHTVLAVLKRERYLYAVTHGEDGRPGWLTTSKTKPFAIDTLAEHLRDVTVTIRTPAALDELHSYTTLANGKTSAPPGYNDDYVMAWSIALAVASRPPQTQRPAVGGQRPIAHQTYKAR